jgi:hypothetical protein
MLENDSSQSSIDTRGGAGRIVPFLIVIGACLAAGILLGALSGGKLAQPDPPSAPPAVFVFLGYDNLKQPQRLNAIWVLNLDGKGHASYYGISPATVFLLESGQPALLREFLADPSGAPARLYKMPNIPQPATAIEFDEQALVSIINRSGGLNMDGKTIRGQDALTMLAGISDPLESLRLQARIVRILFSAAGPCLSESTLAGLSPEHLVANVPTDLLISTCVKRGPYMANAVQVDMLDKVLPIPLPDGSTGLFPSSENN